MMHSENIDETFPISDMHSRNAKTAKKISFNKKAFQ